MDQGSAAAVGLYQHPDGFRFEIDGAHEATRIDSMDARVSHGSTCEVYRADGAIGAVLSGAGAMPESFAHTL